MKRFSVVVFCVICLGCVLIGCDDSSDSKKTAPEYYISFTAWDEAIVLNAEAYGEFDGDSFVLYADDVADTDRYIEIQVVGSAIGTYQNDDITIWFGLDIDSDYTGSSAMSVTVTKNGELGDTIEGTFEASMILAYGSTGDPALEISDGEFKVLHVAEEE